MRVSRLLCRKLERTVRDDSRHAQSLLRGPIERPAPRDGVRTRVTPRAAPLCRPRTPWPRQHAPYYPSSPRARAPKHPNRFGAHAHGVRGRRHGASGAAVRGRARPHGRSASDFGGGGGAANFVVDLYWPRPTCFHVFRSVAESSFFDRAAKALAFIATDFSSASSLFSRCASFVILTNFFSLASNLTAAVAVESDGARFACCCSSSLNSLIRLIATFLSTEKPLCRQRLTAITLFTPARSLSSDERRSRRAGGYSGAGASSGSGTSS